MINYRISERYVTNNFGYRIIRYFIQKKVCFFFWRDVEIHDSYLAAAKHIDILRTCALYEDDDETI